MAQDLFPKLSVVALPTNIFYASHCQLKVGDVLRVMAEQDLDDDNGTWKATEAVLVSSKAENSPNLPSKKDVKMAEARVLMDAEEKLGQVLSQKLRGNGWVALKSIGGWFNGPPEIKEALDIVKTKHIQVRSLSNAPTAPRMIRKNDTCTSIIDLARL